MTERHYIITEARKYGGTPHIRLPFMLILATAMSLYTLTVKATDAGQTNSIFESYFPDDANAGEQLDEYWGNRNSVLLDDDEFFELFRRGLRRCTVNYKGNFLMQHIGSKYVWHKEPDDERALDIIYHASFDPEYRYYAVYSGLSVANPKSERILKRLVDIAMEYEQLGRIIWGVKASNQEQGFEQILETYLKEPNSDKQERAGIVLRAIGGEIDAGQWERQWKQHVQEQRSIRQFGNDLLRIKETFLSGSSSERLEAIKFIRRNNIALSMDNDFIAALDACCQDNDANVRAGAASILGSNFIWAKDNQPDDAVEILKRLSLDEQHEVRYAAVYFGISVVNEKSDAVLQRLIDIALSDDEHNMYDRCCWALRGNEKAREILIGYAENNEADPEKVNQLYYRLFDEHLTEQPQFDSESNTIVSLSLGEGVLFCEAIDELRNSVEPKLNLTVFWRDLEETGIYRDTPVKMGPIEDIPLKTALKLLLNAVDGGRNILDYRLIDGVILIATRAKLSKFGLETRIYDITDLSSPAGEYRSQTSGM